jgi:hypothetical protein
MGDLVISVVRNILLERFSNFHEIRRQREVFCVCIRNEVFDEVVVGIERPSADLAEIKFQRMSYLVEAYLREEVKALDL